MASSETSRLMLPAWVTVCTVGVLALVSGCKTGTVLGSLKSGQVADVHYRRLGCFSSMDRVLAFSRGDGGQMSVKVAAAQDRSRGPLPALQRPLSEEEVVGVDRELEHARTTRETGCTTSKEIDFVVSDGVRELRRAHLMDASCSGPEALYDLLREGTADVPANRVLQRTALARRR
jgi:hypothetical protein